jgi:hypothetical protein
MDKVDALVYPRALTWRVRAGIVAALFVVAVALWSAMFEPPVDPAQIRWLYIVLIGTAVATAALVAYHERLSYKVVADVDGVALLKQGAERRRLHWGEIGRVRFRRLTGELALSGPLAGACIRIDARLHGFHALLREIESRTGRVVECVWL